MSLILEEKEHSCSLLPSSFLPHQLSINIPGSSTSSIDIPGNSKKFGKWIKLVTFE